MFISTMLRISLFTLRKRQEKGVRGSLDVWLKETYWRLTGRAGIAMRLGLQSKPPFGQSKPCTDLGGGVTKMP